MFLFNDRRKLFIIAGIIFVLLVVPFTALYLTKRKTTKNFFELTGLDASDTSQLLLVEGETGEGAVVKEKESIEHFYEIMSFLKFYPDPLQTLQTDWTYRVDIFRGEEQLSRVVFAGKQIQFQDISYGDNESFFVKPGSYYLANKDVGSEIGRLFAGAVQVKLEAETEENDDADEKEKSPVIVKEIFPALAVVCDSFPSAGPSSGLQKADIVYEFLVEGGTTRYLAIFKTLHEENFNIGPIRSLRPYFAVQSLEFGGIVVHSGYSLRTEQMIRGLDLMQIVDYRYFWRNKSGEAPYNLFTNINNLYRAAGKKIRTGEKTLLMHSEPQGLYEKGDIIEIDYSAVNRVRYDYDAAKRVYYRSINGKPHTERETGEQYFAERVIVRLTPHTNIPGTEGLVDINMEGSGRGYLYELGRKTEITWKKVGHETIFSYPGGSPVLPIKGTTWIQVVRN